MPLAKAATPTKILLVGAINEVTTTNKKAVDVSARIKRLPSNHSGLRQEVERSFESTVPQKHQENVVRISTQAQNEINKIGAAKAINVVNPQRSLAFRGVGCMRITSLISSAKAAVAMINTVRIKSPRRKNEHHQTAITHG